MIVMLSSTFFHTERYESPASQFARAAMPPRVQDRVYDDGRKRRLADAALAEDDSVSSGLAGEHE
jgi:hypothetical protein